MRHLCEEFYPADIMPLRRDWDSIFVRDHVTKARTFDLAQLPGMGLICFVHTSTLIVYLIDFCLTVTRSLP